MALNVYQFASYANYVTQKAWCDTNKVGYHATCSPTDGQYFIRLNSPTAGQITQMTTHGGVLV